MVPDTGRSSHVSTGGHRDDIHSMYLIAIFPSAVNQNLDFSKSSLLSFWNCDNE
jgi:hypothetical protein